MTALEHAQAILAQAKAGAVKAEVFFSESESRLDEWSEGLPENRSFTQGRGFGLRLIDQGKLGFASSNVTTAEGVGHTVAQAHAALASVSADASLAIPDRSSQGLENPPDLELLDPALTAETFAARSHFLAGLEADVRRRDPRLTKVLRASYREGRSVEAVANSNGLGISEAGTFVSFSLACVAVEGAETQVGYGFHAARHSKDLDIQGVIDKTVRQTLALLEGKQVPSGRYDLLLDPWVAAEILGLFAEALKADEVQRGKSFLGARQAARVGSDAITVVDEPQRKRGVASAHFDAEGFPTANRTLIERGILKDFFYDAGTAKRVGRSSTGNASRASYKSLPEPGPSNFYIQPGAQTPHDLMQDVSRGLYIHNVMGLHTVDTISGDFSLGIMGEFVERGVRTHGVRGVTIGGNLLDILMNVDAIGSDLTFAGGMGSPTLRVRDISVGGIG